MINSSLCKIVIVVKSKKLHLVRMCVILKPTLRTEVKIRESHMVDKASIIRKSHPSFSRIITPHLLVHRCLFTQGIHLQCTWWILAMATFLLRTLHSLAMQWCLHHYNSSYHNRALRHLMYLRCLLSQARRILHSSTCPLRNRH